MFMLFLQYTLTPVPLVAASMIEEADHEGEGCCLRIDRPGWVSGATSPSDTRLQQCLSVNPLYGSIMAGPGQMSTQLTRNKPAKNGLEPLPEGQSP
jgi:hypothetical protein